jgi:hypothetical protein
MSGGWVLSSTMPRTQRERISIPNVCSTNGRTKLPVKLNPKNAWAVAEALRNVAGYKKFVQWAVNVIQWLKWDHSRRLEVYKV